MIGKIRLGYHGNSEESGYITNRTCRMNDLHMNEVIPRAIELAKQNLDDLEKLLEWNESRNLRFYRVISEIFPHITNWRLMSDKLNFRKLAYDIEQFYPQLKRIGAIARKYGHRITFHPGFFTILNTSNHFTLITAMRELWWHTRFFEMMDADANSVLILHIGGTSNDKPAATKQFITNFNLLPNNIKYRVSIENDEKNFNIEDVLYISRAITPYEYKGVKYDRIPVTFDYFHYKIYNIYRSRNADKYSAVRAVETILPEIADTWPKGRRQKMHLSEQLAYAVLGMHSYLIEEIPKVLLDLDIDIMIEARDNDRAVFYLLERY